MCGVEAPVKIRGERYLLHQTLKGDDYYVICVTNTSPFKDSAEDTVVETQFDFSSAVIYTFEERDGKELPVGNKSVKIDKIGDGAIIVLK